MFTLLTYLMDIPEIEEEKIPLKLTAAVVSQR